jgi:hypothetical protein
MWLLAAWWMLPWLDMLTYDRYWQVVWYVLTH